jgi:hypothetical protein
MSDYRERIADYEDPRSHLFKLDKFLEKDEGGEWEHGLIDIILDMSEDNDARPSELVINGEYSFSNYSKLDSNLISQEKVIDKYDLCDRCQNGKTVGHALSALNEITDDADMSANDKGNWKNYEVRIDEEELEEIAREVDHYIQTCAD